MAFRQGCFGYREPRAEADSALSEFAEVADSGLKALGRVEENPATCMRTLLGLQTAMAKMRWSRFSPGLNSFCTLILGVLVCSCWLPLAMVAQELSLTSDLVNGKIIRANPKTYLGSLKKLRPGDTLQLEAGTYNDPNDVPGLPLFRLHGEPGKPITISGPQDGTPAILVGRAGYNTVRIADCSYIVIRNLLLDGRNLGGDAIKAQGISHHIVIEGVTIKGHGSDQQVVGISTKAPAWDWVIRNNVIVGAGTGIYLGNSDGNAPFVRGIIENNLVVDTVGYNIEIKHQISRPALPGLPQGPNRTIIRDNVFSKKHNSSFGSMARPNVLVGHFPRQGPGADDIYLIYGNLFLDNPSGQPLFQGEGNVALYNNLFVNPTGDAIWIQPHNDVPRRINVFFNTIVASGTGVSIRGGSPLFSQLVIGNAVFAAFPIVAPAQRDNVTGAFASARHYLSDPGLEKGTLDLYPKMGMLKGIPISTEVLAEFPEFDRDFDHQPRDFRFRGAYSGEGHNMGWKPALERKPLREY